MLSSSPFYESLIQSVLHEILLKFLIASFALHVTHCQHPSINRSTISMHCLVHASS